jgi:hypothetical protein
MRLEQIQDFEQFVSEEQVSLSIRVEVILKLIEYGFGDVVGTGGTQALVQQRQHPMHERQLGKVLPVDILPEKNADLLGSFGVDVGPRTGEKQVDFDAHPDPSW